MDIQISDEAELVRKSSEIHLLELFEERQDPLQSEEVKDDIESQLPAYINLEPSDQFLNFKTGTGLPMMQRPHDFIEDMEPYEPIAILKDGILEENIRRDAERMSHQESLMNRVVYDSIDPSPQVHDAERPNALPNFYVPSSKDDYTLVFESRFESGNLRRAVQVYEFEYDLILKPDYNTRGNTQ